MLGGESTRFGLGFAYTNTNVGATGGSGSVAEYMGFAYGRGTLGPVVVDGMAGFGSNDWNTQRADPTGLSSTALKTDASGNGTGRDRPAHAAGAGRDHAGAVRPLPVAEEHARRHRRGFGHAGRAQPGPLRRHRQPRHAGPDGTLGAAQPAVRHADLPVQRRHRPRQRQRRRPPCRPTWPATAWHRVTAGGPPVRPSQLHRHAAHGRRPTPTWPEREVRRGKTTSASAAACAWPSDPDRSGMPAVRRPAGGWAASRGLRAAAPAAARAGVPRREHHERHEHHERCQRRERRERRERPSAPPAPSALAAARQRPPLPARAGNPCSAWPSDRPAGAAAGSRAHSMQKP